MEDWIIIPTYDEYSNIGRLVPEIFRLHPDIRVVVVDDNSPDGTAEAVKKLSMQHKNLLLRSRPGKLGIATAYLETIAYLLDTRKEIGAIITMDADFSHDPSVITPMLTSLKQHDLVVGSRYVRGGALKNWVWWRRFLSRAGNTYARFVTTLPLRDLTTGFMCFRAEALRACDFSKIHSNGFAFLIEIKALLYARGARIKEIPITFVGRYEGASKLSKHIIYEGIIAPWLVRTRNRKQ